MRRFANNPIITPADVKTSREDFEVVCAFNCGAIRFGDKVLLLLRVAERPRQGPGEMVSPLLDENDPSRGIQVLRVKTDDPAFQAEDSRVFRYKGRMYLTSISHLRIARSRDGRNFTVDAKPALLPARSDEEQGIEDPRITKLGGQYYINYSAISRHGIATSLAVTRDFKTFERLGMIFTVENRDVTILPEKVNGMFAAYHRPVPRYFGDPDIWYATSPDLIHWGNHMHVCGARPGMWDGWRIGGGAVPIRSPRGWISIYHGADRQQRYCLGALLTDLENPERVLGRSAEPILSPEAPYEREGFFGNVVFTCGAVDEPDGRVLVYYGAADERVAGAETSIDELLASIR